MIRAGICRTPRHLSIAVSSSSAWAAMARMNSLTRTAHKIRSLNHGSPAIKILKGIFRKEDSYESAILGQEKHFLRAAIKKVPEEMRED